MSNNENCHGCGGVIAIGDEVAHVRLGEQSEQSKWKISRSELWAVMHRRCFLRSINSPKAARMLLEEKNEPS